MSSEEDADSYISDSDDSITKIDVYDHAWENIMKLHKFDERIEIWERLLEKKSNHEKLISNVSNIDNTYKDETEWLKNLELVNNDLIDKTSHHTLEVVKWYSIWAFELHNCFPEFSNEMDVREDIWDMVHELKEYNFDTYDHLMNQILITVDPYFPKEWRSPKSLVFSAPQKNEKDMVMLDVCLLIDYMNWCHQNVFNYCIECCMLLSKHIKKQMGTSTIKFPIISSLKVPKSEAFESSGMMDFDNVVCKGCPHNPHKFYQNTILKHLKHPSNIHCLKKYRKEEIAEIEKISKLRRKKNEINWKKNQYIQYNKRSSEISNLNMMLKKAISNLSSHYHNPKTCDYKWRKKLARIQVLLEKKCWYLKEYRRIQMEQDLEKLENVASHFSNYDDVKTNILEWKEDIESEILQTWQTLYKEIGRKYDYYLSDSCILQRDCNLYDRDELAERKTRKSYEWDALELVHYIDFMHKNSYAMIHELTNLLAKNIKSQMNDITLFPYEVIKKFQIPGDFMNLSDHLKFKREEGPKLCKLLASYFYDCDETGTSKYLSYKTWYEWCELGNTKIPFYDLSEGIKIITNVRIHPQNHPSYPHICYPVDKIIYQEWLKKTSVHNPKSCKEIIPLGEPEVCQCNIHKDCNTLGMPRGQMSTKCEFSFENPVCPFRPRCLGCNYMFGHIDLKYHVQRNPKCFDAYLPAEYNQVLHGGSVCTEDDCESSLLNPICPDHKTCQGCNYMFRFHELEKHLKDHSTCYDAYSPDDFQELVESCNQIKAKKTKQRQKEDYFHHKGKMDEWKQRFITYKITEDDLPPYMLRQYIDVKKNWFEINHLSKLFDEDYSDDDGISERECDYRREFESVLTDHDRDYENHDKKGSKVNYFYSFRRVIFFTAFLPIPGN